MEINGIDIAKQAKKGTIIPLYTVVRGETDPLNLFAKLTDFGQQKNCVLLESAETMTKDGIQSIAVIDPCIKLQCKGNGFSIIALNERGKNFISFIKNDFREFKAKCSGTAIYGKIPKLRKEMDEKKRLQGFKLLDIIRKVAYAFKPSIMPVPVYGGLFGVFSYGFVGEFEASLKTKVKGINFEFVYGDRLFNYNHIKKEICIIANVLVGNGNVEKQIGAAAKDIEGMAKKISDYKLSPNRSPPIKGTIISDCSQNEFVKCVKKLKEHIAVGDIFQAVLSRTIEANYNAMPLEIYSKLRELNPSPYMFYLNFDSTQLIGSSPEKCLSVRNENGKYIVEIRPIAGSKPRHNDADIDGRLEVELKLDEKELAEHTMLVDLARNDVAKISKPGSRVVENPFTVQKFSHIQHLVSTVKGELKEGYDPLHAYIASANPGTLTGAPKIKAMELISKYEKSGRDFYGGAVCYLTPHHEFDSAIVIRTIELRGKKALIRAGAGIVHDSNAEHEFIETQNKAAACLEAIKRAGGVVYENSLH